MKKIIVLLSILCVLLSACGSESNNPTEEQPATNDSVSSQTQTATIPEAADMFTDRDSRTEYESNVVDISLNGSTASANGSSVTVSGSTVTVTAEGTYVLSGHLNGMIIVDAQKTDKLQLVLNGADITSESSAAIYIKQADKVFITLAEGTQNNVSSGNRFVAIDDNNIDGTVYSRDDLTFNGTGSLTVTCPSAHGIVCKDDLVFTGGSYTINCASHGLDANDSVRVTGVKLHITAGKDGIHAENTDDTTLGFVYIESGSFTISAEGDGISAGSDLQIADGSFDITTGGGAKNGSKASSDSYGGFRGGMGGMSRPGSMRGLDTNDTTSDDSTSIKGLKAAGSLTVSGGSFTLDCADDALHANTNVTVTDGSYDIATGDDGLHADAALHISGGMFTVSESYEGVEGLNITISGGDLHLTCSDDGINAAGGTDSSGFGGGRGDMFGGGRGGMGGGMGSSSNGSIEITSGTVYINASGDGIDANGSLTISGGHVTVCGPTKGDTAVLDYDSSATITGGTFIGTGASNMAQSFSSASQGVLGLYTGSRTAGTAIKVTDTTGAVILEYTPALDYGLLIISTPDMVSGRAYTVSIGGEAYEFESS